tara:strand:- start:8013 stop:9608 length:1596 start_codon:yes stop_codon:yes gene_type:complete
MKDFIHNVISELKNNSETSDNSLVKMVIEAVNSSIDKKYSNETVYNQLKEGLTNINEHLKIDSINTILSQFSKKENTTDSAIYDMSKMGNLSEKLDLIRESNAYSDPMISSKVDQYTQIVESGEAEFRIYPSFISDFTQYSHEYSVKKAVSELSECLANNANDFEVLYNIFEMSGINEKTYGHISADLKKMLVTETYSADIIDIKYGHSGLPIVKGLINNLKILEASQADTFTLGGGDGNTRVTDTIAPSVRMKNGSVVSYIDNRFIRISESVNTIKGDTVHIKDNGFTISTVNPESLKRIKPEFYAMSEAFAKLGFKQEGLILETSAVRNLKIGLAFNETDTLDLYLNDVKSDDINSINLTEALSMETVEVKTMVRTIFENLDYILNLKFIKNISNDNTLSESTVFELNGNYFLCKKTDSANRNWNKVDEHEMYTYFKESYNYDVSAIFKEAINETIEVKRAVEQRKVLILENIAKLESSIEEINEAMKSKSLQEGALSKLEKIKDQIGSNVSSLKEEYIELDLSKKEIA